MAAPPIGEKAYLNKASGKMETAKAMKAYRPAGRVAAASRALGAPRGEFNAATGKTESRQNEAAYDRRFPGTNVLNPGGFGTDQLQGIEQLIANTGKARTEQELQPFRARAGEIKGTEATVANRFKGYGEQTQNTLGTLVGQSEAGAKTAENQAAEASLAATKAIETSGQNAQTLNAGYLDPQVRAAMEAGAARTTGFGASAQIGAQARGQAEEGFMRELRATAAQRALEGQQNIASIYGKQLTQNRAQEGQVLARGQAREKEERTELPLRLLTSKLGREKLEQSGEVAKARIGATERGQNLAVARNNANIGQRENANKRTTGTTERDTIKRIEALIAKGQKGTPVSPTQVKLSTELGSAYHAFQRGRTEKLGYNEIRNALSTGKEVYKEKGGTKTIKEATAKVQNQVIVKAAEELWNTHRVSKATRALMGKLGMNIGTDAEAYAAVQGR